MTKLNIKPIHASWSVIVKKALTMVDHSYLELLNNDTAWLPGSSNIFNAFSMPLIKVSYILLGESPYPRPHSANGFAFWDAHVNELWSSKGLSSEVNRATSLRNFIKMFLIARGDLTKTDTSQQAISKVDKTKLISTIRELFDNMMKAGIMPLNAILALTRLGIKEDSRAWQPFLESIFKDLAKNKSRISLILLGKIANEIKKFECVSKFKQFSCEHPYNISFITNEKVINFFKPFDLLEFYNNVSNSSTMGI